MFECEITLQEIPKYIKKNLPFRCNNAYSIIVNGNYIVYSDSTPIFSKKLKDSDGYILDETFYNKTTSKLQRAIKSIYNERLHIN